MNSNKITIVTPSFNQGEFIERTIKSIWDQEGDFYIEHIIADGGSGDNSIEIIRKYDKLLKEGAYPLKCKGIDFVWWSKKDNGQSNAINLGFKKATGDFIAWQNSDDIFYDGAFQWVIDAFEKYSKEDLVFGNFNFIDKQARIIQQVYYRPFSKWEFLYVCPNITNQSAFWKKSLMDRAGLLDEEYHYGMDFEFFVRLSNFGKFKYIDKFFGGLRIHEDSKTVSTGENIEWKKEYAKIREKNGIYVDTEKDWSGQYVFYKAYFFIRRFFWYVFNRQFIYLFGRLKKDACFQSWKDNLRKNEGEKKRIAVLHPEFSLGGASAIAIFTLEALREKFDLCLVTTEKVDINQVNNFYGTNFREDDFESIITPKNEFIRKIIEPAFLLKVAFVQRYIKKEQKKFDFIIATRCEMELGEKKGIQYINLPAINDEAIREIGQMPEGLFQNDNFIRKIYYYFFWKISGMELSKIKKNITLVDSNWAGKVVEKTYGISDYKVVYPPVSNNFLHVEWDQKENGFVMIGYVDATKRTIDVIRILQKVKEINKDLHLHIIGRDSGSEYALKVDRIIENNNEWVSWEKNLGKKEVEKLVSKHRFGIHGMKNEHFGIAVAELVNAGCIPFIHNSGGQVEIVRDDRLIYNSDDDAVDKINRVIANEGMQIEIREKLREKRFSKDIFEREILEIVENSIT